MNSSANQAIGAAAGIGGFCFIVIIAYFIFWLIQLIDILKNDFTNPTNKIIWLIVVFFTGPIGAPLYYFIGRDQKIQTANNDDESPRRRRHE